MSRVVLIVVVLALNLGPVGAATFFFNTNAVWRYFKGRSEASTPDPATWRQRGFEDAGWSNGVAPFYYGETYPVGTLLSDMQSQYTSLYLRRTFVVTNLEEVGGLRLVARSDDGFVAWINGIEVKRYNVPTGSLPYGTNASTSVPEPIPFTFYDLTNGRSALLAGTNVMTVHGLNASLSSGDFVIDLALTFEPPDFQPPTIASFLPVPGTVTGLTQITVTFTEPVLGVNAADLLVNGQSATAVTGSNATWQFTFPRPAYGQVPIGWAAGHGIVDRAIPGNPFNGEEVGETWSYELIDLDPPRVTEMNPPPGGTCRRLTQVEVTFNEGVIGVEAPDLLVNGQPATNLTAIAPGTFLFRFSEPAPGTVQVTWSTGHGIRDEAPAGTAFAGGNWTWILDPSAVPPPVRINEFLAANQLGLRDEDGEPQDWIELYNGGTNAVNLSGWSLTDDPDQPALWTFSDVTIGANSYLVVLASGKDRRVPISTNLLHTSFKLGVEGEYLALFNAEAPRELMSGFAPYPEQRNDYSCGYDTPGELRYFQAPTPGATNGTSEVVGMAAPACFSVGHGFFNAPFTLHLTTATPGAEIRYTTDGSVPAESTGQVYTGPLQIERTTVMRAAVFKTNHLPSTVETRTYLFLEDVLVQGRMPPGYPAAWGTATADYEMDTNVVNDSVYGQGLRGDLMAIPSVSIVMDVAQLFGTNGIYSNPTGTGLAWERPGSVEMIDPTGRNGFQVNCGVRIQGGYGRNPSLLKHSFRFLFKGDYGPGKLDYPFFEDSPVREFDTLVLRAGMNNSYVLNASSAAYATFLQDEWMRQAQRDMGHVSGHGNFVHLYLNGLYWGMYNVTERPSAPFMASYFGGDKAEWDALNSSEAIDGTKTTWNTLQALANAGVTNESQYQAIRQFLDVENLVDYMLLNFYGGNQDWDNHNWYAARRRVPGAGYRFFVWDGERTLESITAHDKTGVNEADKPSRLYAQLRTFAEFRLLFADRVHRHLFNDGVLAPGPAAARLAILTNRVYRAVVGESARWGDKLREPPFTRNAEWLAEINREMGQYFPARASNVVAMLRAKGLYPAVTAPSFSRHGGKVTRGFSLWLSAPAGAILYTTDGSDPREYGTGAVSARATVYAGGPVVVDRAMIVKARVLEVGTSWSALNEASFQVGDLGLPLRITEINYHPAGGDAYEFVEILNAGVIPIDLGLMRLSGVGFQFVPGTMLAGGARLVVASSVNPAVFAARYPEVPVAGYFAGSLANAGERVALEDSRGETIVSVTYDDEHGWPMEADGGGASLEIIDPQGDPDDPANWRASGILAGTPGQDGSPLPPPPVLLNEIMAVNLSAVTNGGACPDWVELHNPGGTNVNLQGWSLTDDGNPGKFVFPEMQLAPGGYLVVWCDQATNAPGLHTGFALDREGELLALYDPAGNRVDAISFGLQVSDTSIGRVGNDWRLTAPTPGSNNIAAALAPAAYLRINEWMADPVPGEEDWLELRNVHPSLPVALRGLQVATSNSVFRLSSLYFIAPAGHGRWVADEAPGADHLDLRLPAAGGFIALYGDAGTELDRVAYALQSQGVSQGRWPDGGGGITNFVGSASPGASNYLRASPGLVLNEIMAWNIASEAVDSAGRRADWIELHNAGSGTVDLSNMSLSEGEPKPGQWFFPSGTSLPPGGYLVVWCDGLRPESAHLEPDLNFGRALESEGGRVSLFNSSGQVLDVLEYGLQVADMSVGRSGGAWRLLTVPTPGATNSAPSAMDTAAGLLVNEWMADPLEGSDWFELYNLSALPVELSGLYLSDDPSVTGWTNTQIRPLSYIGGGAFVVFLADGDEHQRADHVGFALDGAGETVVLCDRDLRLLDSVAFGRQTAGVAEGRLPDGGGQVSPFYLATPGAANTPDGPPIITMQPQNQTVGVGSNVSFMVTAVPGRLSYQWFFGVTNLLVGATNTTLSCSNVQAELEGDYWVVVSNRHGVLTSAVARLSVLAPPRIVEHPQSQTVLAGETVLLSVRALGTQPMGFRWRRNNSTILPFEQGRSSIVLTNVQDANAGTYTVVVTNLALLTPGVISSNAVLTVLADNDRDGMSDLWETTYGLNTVEAGDAAVDSDGDGLSNREEYLVGTDPRASESVLKLELSALESAMGVRFLAQSNHSYAVLYRDDPDRPRWSKLAEVAPAPTNRWVLVPDINPAGYGRRFYRLVTPRSP